MPIMWKVSQGGGVVSTYTRGEESISSIFSSFARSVGAAFEIPTTNNDPLQLCTETDVNSCVNNLVDDDDDDGRHYDIISEAGYQASSPASVKGDRVGSDMGEPQVVDTASNAIEIAERIIDARRYIQDTVMLDEKYNKVRDMCLNLNSQCAFWAVSGECDINPAYMHTNCAPVCYTCEKLHVETRCPLDPNVSSALNQPGDLNTMFEHIASDPYYQQFKPVVLSRPTYAPGDTAANATYQVNSLWMIMFDNVVNETEADRLIELGGHLGYERSSDVGDLKADGTYGKNVNSGRTSTNAWCVGDCFDDQIAQTVMDRIANITGIPEPNSENLQLLRYEHGQYYQTHNDYIPYQLDRPCGVRILTFYIYLNDVEEGGGTNFPNLGLTVTPQKGRAVLWPSVYNDRPNEKDPRSDHQAMPVLKGVKYGANAWIHQRDFKSANKVGCS
jgi:prolyl 4-hydroxylase